MILKQEIYSTWRAHKHTWWSTYPLYQSRPYLLELNRAVRTKGGVKNPMFFTPPCLSNFFSRVFVQWPQFFFWGHFLAVINAYFTLTPFQHHIRPKNVNFHISHKFIKQNWVKSLNKIERSSAISVLELEVQKFAWTCLLVKYLTP